MATKEEYLEDEPPITRARWSVQERIAAFAMLDAMGDASLAQKTLRLSIIGFPAKEIAEMLQTTPATVYQYVYQAKNRPRARPGKPKPTN
jgi:DNA-directed RNA polymerase specialized sigma24 family protein